jgi:stage III sporulation protein AH
MMLKKQTVWLLTMLSLIIVLSVYYMTTPVPSPGQLATTDQEEAGSEQEAVENQSGDVLEGETASSKITGDSGFTAYEMERADNRSRLRAQYQAVVASASSTAAEIAEASEKLEALQELSTSEQTLESLLEAKEGYQAVLVSTSGENVNVIVKTDHQSTQQANEVILLTKEHLGKDKHVAVTFQLVE